MKSVTEWDRSVTNFPGDGHSEIVDRPVTESVSVRAGFNTYSDCDKQSAIRDRLGQESVTARATEQKNQNQSTQFIPVY